MGALQKGFALVGGIAVAVLVIYVVNGLYPLTQDMMIILGVVLAIFAGMSLYFMTKSSSG